MELSVICIGDELLKGATVNTNMASIGEALLGIGVIPKLEVCVPDAREPLLEALDFALLKSDFVITSGGLGPTADDITKNVVAGRFGMPLVESKEVVEDISSHWKKLKRGPMPPRLLSQALVPEGAQILPNRCGTAPGLLIPAPGGKAVLMLPGPPAELVPMFREQGIPVIRARLESPLHAKLLHVVGVPESTVEDRMLPLITGFPALSVAYCASPEHVRVFLTSRDPELVNSKAHEVAALFQGELLSPGFNSLPEELLALMRESGLKLAVAESCTGGSIAESLTAIPGSSDAFLGGVVSYSNDVKASMLGVSQETLKSKGAVSEECAREMVEGVCARFGAGAGMAVTGIAGPSGGSSAKPVGLVFAAAKCGGRVLVKEWNFRGGREQIRKRAAAAAMNMLRRLCLKLD